MLKYSEDSEALKVSTREMKEQHLSLNEPSVKIVAHCEASEKGEQQKTCSRCSADKDANEDPSRKYGEMGGAFETGDCVGEVMPGTQGRS